MVKEYLSAQKVYQDKASGKMVNVYTGVMKQDKVAQIINQI